MKPSNPDVTGLLLAWSRGDQDALDQLTPLVHEELHRLAQIYMSRERPGHMLQTTALVNEAFLRLIDTRRIQWESRAHFFAVSAHLMRRILVDFARTQHSLKRGGEVRHVSFEEALKISDRQEEDLVALDDALSTLAVLDPRQSRVVELRFFGGLNVEETAEVLKVSPETVKRDWRLAKVWLLRQISAKEAKETVGE